MALPRGGKGLALVRWLVHLPSTAIAATDLAKRVGVSQPRASQVLKQLVEQGLIERRGRFEWNVRREEILERFLVEYRGPRGEVQHYYSLRSPNEAAVDLSKVSGKRGHPLVSGDVAADLVAPHKSPERLVVYQLSDWRGVPADWVEASGPDDANITVVVPQDASVAVVSLAREFKGETLMLADPTQILWDLHHAGGDDRLEGAERLRTWILNTPYTS